MGDYVSAFWLTWPCPRHAASSPLYSFRGQAQSTAGPVYSGVIRDSCVSTVGSYCCGSPSLPGWRSSFRPSVRVGRSDPLCRVDRERALGAAALA